MKKKEKFTSFEELYIENKKLVYAVVLEYVKNPDDVADIVSIIWLKIFQKEKRLLSGDRKAIKGYLRAAAKTTALDYIRVKQRERAMHEELCNENILISDENSNEFDEEMNNEDVREKLRYAVAMLDEEEKLLIHLRFNRNLRTKEIGIILGITHANVRIRLMRTLKKIKLYYTSGGKEMVTNEKE